MALAEIGGLGGAKPPKIKISHPKIFEELTYFREFRGEGASFRGVGVKKIFPRVESISAITSGYGKG